MRTEIKEVMLRTLRPSSVYTASSSDGFREELEICIEEMGCNWLEEMQGKWNPIVADAVEEMAAYILRLEEENAALQIELRMERLRP